ncbi:MAG: helix-turn-helix transcriptional regulator [Alphaproteobacteria bacterium]|nr:helix-turn-helix transcriptional regulator [Alphaproteobacteria bacterium]
MTTIGDRLRQIRLTLNKTQDQIAKDISVGKATWQNYEYGTTQPSYAVLEDLSKQGFDMNWMISGKGGMYQNIGVAESQNFPSEFTTLFLQKAYESALKIYIEKAITIPEKFSQNLFQEVSQILKTASTENEADLLLKHYLNRL